MSTHPDEPSRSRPADGSNDAPATGPVRTPPHGWAAADTQSPQRVPRVLPPDPWLDAPEPGRDIDDSQSLERDRAVDSSPTPSIYGGQSEPAGDAAPTAADGGIPDPWSPRVPLPPVPMPSTPGRPSWNIPRLEPRQEPAPMPHVPGDARPAGGSYSIPQLPPGAEPASSAPEPVDAEPESADVEQPPPSVEPQPTPFEPEPASVEPQPTPFEPQPLPTPPPAHLDPPAAQTAPSGPAAPPSFPATPPSPSPSQAQPTPHQLPAQQAQPSYGAGHPEPSYGAGHPEPGYGPVPAEPAGRGFLPPPVPPSGAFAVPHPEGPAMPTRIEGAPGQPPVVPLDLSQAALVHNRKQAPKSGWRRALYKASFGGINPGISKEQSERNALVERIRTPIDGCHKIAVVSLKGGIGKTTTTSCLGLTLAHYRGDRVVALDANPDAGTLAERLTGVTDVSVRDMLEHLDDVRSFTDISRYMSLAGRLQVLASDQDAEVSEAFDDAQYTRITDMLARYYNVVLTDSGTGMLHSAMKGTLQEADSLVVVGAPSVDGSSRASKTLDWLVAHGYGELVARSVAVISSVRQKSESVDMNVLRNHFGARCRAVVEIPYDPHLVIGGRIDMAQLKGDTELAYLALAAAVADGFVLPRR